ncbi:MAG: hypothetical protein CMJ89_09725 [Planctomycetes bacterium]|nr:hypothetical protein [Planctomycetota bacterium]
MSVVVGVSGELSVTWSERKPKAFRERVAPGDLTVLRACGRIGAERPSSSKKGGGFIPAGGFGAFHASVAEGFESLLEASEFSEGKGTGCVDVRVVLTGQFQRAFGVV